MTVLGLLLSRHPAARAKAELHEVIAAPDARKFLLVPVEFLDALPWSR